MYPEHKPDIIKHYTWLAEHTGSSILTITSDGDCILNSHAMILLDIDSSFIKLSQLSNSIKNFESFKTFLGALSNDSDSNHFKINPENSSININATGFKDPKDGKTYLLLQPSLFDSKYPEYLCNYAINAENAFALWNCEQKLLFQNEKFEPLFQRTTHAIQNNFRNIFTWVHEEDQEHVESQLSHFTEKPTQSINTDVRFNMPDNSIKWINFRLKNLFDGSGEIYRTIGVFKDVTPFKIQEKELALSKSSLDQNLIPIYWVNSKAEVVYANKAAADKLGYTLDELISSSIYDIDTSSREYWKSVWKRMKSKKADSFESIQIHKNGSTIPVEIFASFLELDDQEIVFAYVIDNKEKKAYEEKIIYKQQFEHLLLEISKRFINTPYNQVSEAIDTTLREICEFTSSESAYVYKYNLDYEKIDLLNFYSSTASADYKKQIESLPILKHHFEEISTNRLVIIESVSDLPANDPLKDHCMKHHIGSLIDLGLFYQNTNYGFFGIYQNEEGHEWNVDEIQLFQVIGDLFMNALQRADSMKNLLESEQNYRAIFNATSDAIIILEPNTGIVLDVNSAMLQMWKYSYEEALGTKFDDLSAPFGHQHMKPMEFVQAARQSVQTHDWLVKNSQNDTFWTEAVLRGAEINSQQIIIAVLRDITDRRHTQTRLKESEAKYRMIIEGQSELIIHINASKEILFASPTFESVYRTGPEKLTGRNFMDFVLKEDKDVVTNAFKNLNKPPYNCFFELESSKNEVKKWYAWNFTKVDDDSIGVGRDITYQKLVENALRESEDRFRSIVQNLSDVVFLLDEKANINYVTPSCEKYLGVRVEELLGNNILNIIHNDDKGITKENIDLHIEGNDFSLPYELRLKHVKDDWKIFEARSQNLLENEAVQGIIFTISDITERKLVEKQVLNAIIKTEEKERERFAKDLHDDLGPLLSSIKMYVGMLDKVDKEEKKVFIVKNLQEIVKEAITTTKDVSNDLNPHVLNNYGLTSALKLFIEKLLEKIDINFEEDLGDGRYPEAIELSLYRISKELINNTLKHASADKISLKLSEKGNNILLYYEDNGVGLPANAFEVKRPGGMGLSNIISRAKSLNAKHTFYTNIKKGFKFEMQIPLIQD